MKKIVESVFEVLQLIYIYDKVQEEFYRNRKEFKIDIHFYALSVSRFENFIFSD
jgi:hypothetical protein